MKALKPLSVALLSAALAFAPISIPANAVTTPAPSVINFPIPDVKDVSKKIAKVGRANAIMFAANKLFDGIDWVMDPANNQAITKEIITRDEQGYLTNCMYGGYTYNGNRVFPNIKILAETVAANIGTKQSQIIIQDNVFTVTNSRYGRDYREYVACRGAKKTASYDQIAQEILNNALQGHPDSVKFVQEVAEEKAREEAEAKAKEREKEEEDKKKKCLPVTEPNIRMVLEPTTELTAQDSVSLAKIKGMVTWIENGGATSMDPIRVYENYLIVNGNHRFIAMKLCRMNAPRINWAASQSDIKRAYPIKNIRIDESWYGD